MHLGRATTESRGLAKERPGCIQHMRADVGEDELLQLFEKRLVFEDRKAIRVRHSSPKHPADPARVQDRLQFPERPLPAPVFVDEQRNSGLLARREHVRCMGEGGGERLLADNGSLVRRGQFHKTAMRVHVGVDVNEVGLSRRMSSSALSYTVGTPNSPANFSALARVRSDSATLRTGANSRQAAS